MSDPEVDRIDMSQDESQAFIRQAIDNALIVDAISCNAVASLDENGADRMALMTFRTQCGDCSEEHYVALAIPRPLFERMIEVTTEVLVDHVR